MNVKGISSSVGSACSSHTLEPSHVIMALGKDIAKANSSVRFSISKYTTKEEIGYALEEIKKTVDRLRKISPLV